MSEKEKEYTKFKDEVDKYFGGLRPEITDYVEELKAEKGELIEILKKCHYFVKASCNGCNMDKRIESILKKHER